LDALPLTDGIVRRAKPIAATSNQVVNGNAIDSAVQAERQPAGQITYDRNIDLELNL